MSKAGAIHLGHFIHAYERCGLAGQPPEVSVCTCSQECKHQPSGHYAEQEQGPWGQAGMSWPHLNRCRGRQMRARSARLTD